MRLFDGFRQVIILRLEAHLHSNNRLVSNLSGYYCLFRLSSTSCPISTNYFSSNSVSPKTYYLSMSKQYPSFSNYNFSYFTTLA